MPLMDIQEISDRLEIDAFLTTYAKAVDTKDWALWRSIFTEDAHIDYISAGGEAGDRETIATWLETSLSMFQMTQHLISNIDIELDGDSARVRAMFYNPMQFNDDIMDGKKFFCGGYYNHELVRTADGWKSRKLVEESQWTEGM